MEGPAGAGAQVRLRRHGFGNGRGGGARLLRMAYHVLANGTVYREAGADYYDRHHSQRVTRRALQTLERQGYRVTLEPAA